VSDANPHHNRKRSLAIGLAAAGVLVSLYLELLHVQTYLGIGDASLCEVGDHVSCTSVALSGASVLFGVPMPVWGAAGFLAMGNAAVRRSKLLLPLAGFSALASIALLVYEIVAVGSICMFCELVHLLCFALLGVAWVDRKSPKSEIDVKSLAGDLGLPAALVLAVGLFAPAYWMAASWGSGTRLPHGVTEEGRPWLGSENPDLVVHEYTDYACPHCKIATGRMKMRLAGDHGIRVVRHQQPRMPCGDAPSKAERCFHARAAICAGEQDRFWEMDDWLFHHASGKREVDVSVAAQEVGLDLGALRTCMESSSTYQRAQRDVDEAREWGIRGTPGYVVDGKRLEIAEFQQLLADR
jgi:uncharacterized membrane protein